MPRPYNKKPRWACLSGAVLCSGPGIPAFPVYPESLLRRSVCFRNVFAYIFYVWVERPVPKMDNPELIRRLKIVIIALATYLALC
jgi:hypothetical protein